MLLKQLRIDWRTSSYIGDTDRWFGMFIPERILAICYNEVNYGKLTQIIRG